MANISDLRRRFQNSLSRSSQAFLRTEAINTSGTSYAIANVDTSNDYFQVNDVDLSADADFTQGNKIYIDGSTANDAIFEVSSVSTGDFDAQTDGTDSRINVVESIKDGTADGSIYVDKDYQYVNFGRIKNTSLESDLVNSEEDQSGRMSSHRIMFTVTLTMVQGSNVELSILPDLAQPPLDGNDNAYFINYPRGYDFYANGHFLYLSGDNQVPLSDVNAAVVDDTDAAKDGELLTNNNNYNLADDDNGLMFQNVLMNPGPSLDLGGGENVISVEFQAEVPFSQLESLDTDRKIQVSPSGYYEYA